MKHALVSFLFIIFAWNLYAVDVEIINLTQNDDASIAGREKVIDLKDNDGIRLSWNGMKQMNKDYKTGGVDSAVSAYEAQMEKAFTQFQADNPGVEVTVKKMDFKGYYITCTPTEASCTDKLQNFVEKLPAGKIGGEHGGGKVIDFTLTAARGGNYEEGYVRARAISSYKGDAERLTCRSSNCPDLGSFIDEKMKEAIAEAKQAGFSADPTDKAFANQLEEAIETVRAGGYKELTPEQKPLAKLVEALDSLVETPFKNSNNLDKELEDALKATPKVTPPDRFSIHHAKSGDDLFMIIKDKDGKVLKVLGADARGLGVLNMMARYNQIHGHYQNNASIASFDDMIKLSDEATTIADGKMGKSIDTYTDTIAEYLRQPGVNPDNINDYLEAAHLDYYERTQTNKSLMQMRSASVPDCGINTKCVKDSVTTVHNLLKKMEASGYDSHFGNSCVGLHYWMRKNNVKWPEVED